MAPPDVHEAPLPRRDRVRPPTRLSPPKWGASCVCVGFVEKPLCVWVEMDFDGCVIGTNRHAEGQAVRFNRKKKGQRKRNHPLLGMVAQMGQVLDAMLPCPTPDPGFEAGSLRDLNEDIQAFDPYREAC